MTREAPDQPGHGDESLAGKQAIRELVRRFHAQEAAYLEGRYNETQVRREFIDPLFVALGWDVDNRAGLPEPYKDVVHEDALRIGDKPAAPDYGFRVAGVRKFFVEAKKPSVNVHNQIGAAFQLRRYAWSAKLPMSVVTDFEELAVYDCRLQPEPADNAATARILYLRYDEYVDRWPELWELLSRDAVDAGSIERFVAGLRARRGVREVDAAFLTEISAWREQVARDVAARNTQLTTRELNRAVQATIDRIIFLRICEDRGIEEHGRLEAIAQGPGIYRRLCRLYEHADMRYNSGLFHFRPEKGRDEEPDRLSLDLSLGDEVLSSIIGRLYDSRSPYEFSVIPADILGQVYEQFLGEVIVLDENHEARVEQKPEVRKAGGVFYTPTAIVDQIVRETLGPLVSESTPKRVSMLRVLDPACGSGSFLLQAYEFLVQWHRDWYVAHRPERHSQKIFQGPNNQWMLSGAEKKRILLNNIFGVDVDAQAVEVTKLSLLLKVLENESEETINRQLQLLHERALPDLGNNVRWGNSLIGSEIYGQVELEADEEAEIRINAFDWRDAFPRVFADGGFDAVIGNPPWLMAGYHVQSEVPYFKNRYITATGKFDLYYLFLERATELVRGDGRIGMIVPNKFFHTAAARQLRQLLGGGRWLRSIVDFRQHQVFPTATNYSCILSLRAGGSDEPRYTRAKPDLDMGRTIAVPWSSLGANEWFFLDRAARELFERIRRATEPLEVLTARFGTGIQSGADRILALDPAEATKHRLEAGLLEPFLRGRDVRRYGQPEASRQLVFPYAPGVDDRFALLEQDELASFPMIRMWLDRHRQTLERRIWFGRGPAELSGGWYGLMYLDAPSTFDRPHLLTPSLSPSANFTLGNGMKFATGTAGVTSVVPKEQIPEDLLYLLGVLNSRLLSRFATVFSPIFSGGHFKFSAPYLKGLPIKRIQSRDEVTKHDAIVDLVRRRLRSETDPDLSEMTIRRRQALEHEIDELTYQLYGLSDEDIEVLVALED